MYCCSSIEFSALTECSIVLVLNFNNVITKQDVVSTLSNHYVKIGQYIYIIGWLIENLSICIERPSYVYQAMHTIGVVSTG